MQHEKTTRAREALIRSMIHGAGSEKKLEELLDILVDEKFSLMYLPAKEKCSLRDRLTDKLALFFGSRMFILIFSASAAIWIFVNEFMLKVPFDPYPFILLNLLLSLISAVQSPIIMMSQNRQAEADRKRSELQYNINLKCEVLLEDIHIKLEKIIEMMDEQK